jgi:hypothetical protein
MKIKSLFFIVTEVFIVTTEEKQFLKPKKQLNQPLLTKEKIPKQERFPIYILDLTAKI